MHTYALLFIPDVIDGADLLPRLHRPLCTLESFYAAERVSRLDNYGVPSKFPKCRGKARRATLNAELAIS